MSWQPQRYLAFDDHRTRPGTDLLARVPLAAPERVVDLGCGPGNSTELLTARWPDATVVGVDNSPTMLAAARERRIGADWVEADIATWTPDTPVDLLFSNAVLQWLPDHATLLPRLLGLLRPGGVLAVQMPRNFEAPSHTTVHEIAALDADRRGARTRHGSRLPLWRFRLRGISNLRRRAALLQ
jgi:trans-aconitate 2-methyltransferase